MKILLVKTGCHPKVVAINSGLETMQKMVGGSIEAIYPFEDDVALVCNEEGKLRGLPLNRALRDVTTGQIYDIIAGTFFICGALPDEEDFSSLTEEQCQKYGVRFQNPEMFFKLNSQIVAIPVQAEAESELQF